MNAPRAIDWIKYLSSIELEFHFPSNVESVLANISAKIAIEAKSKTIFVSNVVASLLKSMIHHYIVRILRLSVSKCTSLKMYLNGMGFRGISRVTGVAHTTIINWVKQVGKLLPDTYDAEDTPQVGEVDELQTFIGKKNKVWIWTARLSFSVRNSWLGSRGPKF